MSAPYLYPTPNSELIKAYNLEKHFEGGYFAQTVLLESGIPTPAASPSESALPISQGLNGKVQVASGSATELVKSSQDITVDKNGEVDATQIFYLLTPDSYRGRMHMNLHAVSFLPYCCDEYFVDRHTRSCNCDSKLTSVLRPSMFITQVVLSTP